MGNGRNRALGRSTDTFTIRLPSFATLVEHLGHSFRLRNDEQPDAVQNRILIELALLHEMRDDYRQISTRQR